MTLSERERFLSAMAMLRVFYELLPKDVRVNAMTNISQRIEQKLMPKNDIIDTVNILEDTKLQDEIYDIVKDTFIEATEELKLGLGDPFEKSQ